MTDFGFDLDAQESATMSKRDWSQLLLTVAVHRRKMNEDSVLYRDLGKLINDVGGQVGLDYDQLDAYRQELRDDPEYPYQGEEWERETDE